MKTKIPTTSSNPEPKVLNKSFIHKKLEQKQYYDKTAKELPKLEVGEKILIQNGNIWEKGKVKKIVNERSYVVENQIGKTYRRNRKYLRKTKLNFPNNSDLAIDPNLYEDLEFSKNSKNDQEFESDQDNYETAKGTLDYNEAESTSSNEIPISQRPRRLRKRPSYLNDYQTTFSDTE